MNKVVEPVATATLKEDGGAAFPVNRRDTVRDSLKVVSDGMSLRDYFAAQALNAIVIVTSFGKHIPQREALLLQATQRGAAPNGNP